MSRDYSAITNEILKFSELLYKDNQIAPELFIEHKVYRGLRDLEGNGVLTGLTRISEIESYKMIDGQKVFVDGKLFYRGYDVEELVKGFIAADRFGFEEIAFLLLFGQLPTAEELDEFKTLLSSYRSLPSSFVRDVIMKAPSNDMMVSLARSVLTLYSYDKRANDISIPNVLRQCLQLIATFPLLAVYGFQAYDYYLNDRTSFFIHEPRPELSTAENILHMLRLDSKYSKLEAVILDLALVLHAEHGGGNNSTFTTRVVTSSGTDTYSAIAAALASLKGPKHGGANFKVMEMFENIKSNVKDWKDKDEVKAYLKKILNKEAFDKAGLIYGIGHAIYSVSDPRAKVFKSFV
ncbi:MAG TPA: citrate synthase, partial [Clostridia bacterium]